MMNQQELNVLFQKYIEKTASPEEVEQLLSHFSLDGKYDQLREMIIAEMGKYSISDNVISLHDEVIFSRVKLKLDNQIAALQARRYRIRWMVRFSVSAAASIVLIGGYLLWQGVRNSEMITVTTAYGQIKELTLPDSSKLWLNAGSSVSYPKRFTTRKININNGDVFFAIHHEPDRPLTVNAQNVRVSVLGTSFEVAAYKTDHEIKVAVTSGKVGISIISSRTTTTFLTPGKQASVEGNQIAVANIAADDIAAWRNDRMVFDNELLGSVMQSLERKYNVHITVESQQLLNQKVTMHLNNQPLGDILAALSFSNHIRYQIVNEKSVIVK